jgi:integrase
LAAKWVKDGFMEQHFGKKPEVSFTEALLRYAEVHKRDHPQHFLDKTRYRLKLLANWFGDFNLSEISLAVVLEFMNERLSEVSLATAQKDVATLKAILNKAHREELFEVMPHFPKLKALKPRNRWISEEEEERLVRAESPHIAPLIRFAVDTGGRLSELLRLDWRMVDMVNKRATFVNTKNGEDRTVRLCDRAVAILIGLHPKDGGAVFTYKGKAMKRVKTSFGSARKKAGLEDVRFHDLRHTFASRLVQGGVSLYDVMHFTGHKSLDMVQRYAHLAPNYQEGAIQVLNNRRHDLGTVEICGTV